MDKKGKARIFGYQLTKSNAKTVYYSGIALFALTLVVLVWIIYWVTVSASTWKVYADYDVPTLGMWLWTTYLVVDIAFMFLACYMIRCSKVRIEIN